MYSHVKDIGIYMRGILRAHKIFLTKKERREIPLKFKIFR